MNAELTAAKRLLLGVMAYETTALLTGRLPTISWLCCRYPVLRYLLQAVLDTHLDRYRAEPR